MGKTAFNQTVVTPTTICASAIISSRWQTRRSANQTLGPHAHLRNHLTLSSWILTRSRLRLPSLMPSSASSAQNSRLCSTLNLAVHITLPGSVR